MFGLGKKDEDGKQVRIEHRGKYARASRSGGVSVRGEQTGLSATTLNAAVRPVEAATRASHIILSAQTSVTALSGPS